MLNLIVDDGVPNRINRKTLFNERFETVGISSAFHKMYGKVTVLFFATSDPIEQDMLTEEGDKELLVAAPFGDPSSSMLDETTVPYKE